MESFIPLLFMLFFWIIIAVPISAARKAANQKKSAPPVPKAPAEDQPSAGPVPAAPERLTALTPSLSEPDHDDSVFTGSLGALSTEGYDPCHAEQMSAMESVCVPGNEPAPASQVRSGLPLGWTGNDVVRGIVMSEILNRKKR